MKLMLILVIATSFAYAGKIVPNIKWNKIEQNETGAAAGLSNRNNVSYEYSNNQSTTEFLSNESRAKNTDHTVSSNLKVENTSLEIAIEKDIDHDDDEKSNEIDTISFNLGQKISDKFTVGVEGAHKQTELGNSNYKVGISSTIFIAENIILGAGVANDHQNGSDLNDFKTYLFGGGFISEKMALEGFVEITPSKENDSFESSEISVLGLQGTINIGSRFQLSPTVRFTDDIGIFNSEKSRELLIESEFMINSQFYIGGQLAYSSNEVKDDFNQSAEFEVESKGVGFTARYKKNKFQLTARYLYLDSTLEIPILASDAEVTGNLINLNMAYFF